MFQPDVPINLKNAKNKVLAQKKTEIERK